MRWLCCVRCFQVHKSPNSSTKKTSTDENYANKKTSIDQHYANKKTRNNGALRTERLTYFAPIPQTSFRAVPNEKTSTHRSSANKKKRFHRPSHEKIQNQNSPTKQDWPQCRHLCQQKKRRLFSPKADIKIMALKNKKIGSSRQPLGARSYQSSPTRATQSYSDKNNLRIDCSFCRQSSGTKTNSRALRTTRRAQIRFL